MDLPLDKFFWCLALIWLNWLVGNFLLLLLSGWFFCSAVAFHRRDPTLNRRGERVDFFKLLACFGALWLLFPPERVDLQFVSCFFLGANFTLADKWMFLRRIGDKLVVPSRWATFSAVELAALGVLGLCLSGGGLWALWQLWDAPPARLTAAGGGYAAAAAVFALAALRLRESHEPHAHHNLLALLGAPLLGAAQAVSLGVFVEGSCRWGLKAPFDAKKNPQRLKWVHG